MREDLISRQAALDAIQQRADEIDSVYSAFWEGLIIAQDIVNNIPSAEPEERTAKVKRNALEEDIKLGNITFKAGTNVISKCECGTWVRVGSKYCHMCGARLEWE